MHDLQFYRRSVLDASSELCLCGAVLSGFILRKMHHPTVGFRGVPQAAVRLAGLHARRRA